MNQLARITLDTAQRRDASGRRVGCGPSAKHHGHDEMERDQISPELAMCMYRLATNPTLEDQLEACDLFAALPASRIEATERYVRAALVSQGLVA